MRLANACRSAWYHGKTLWLFTASDIKSIVIPTMAFGLFSTLSGPVLGFEDVNPLYLVGRSMILFWWAWMNLLLLCINNQRKAEDIQEDRVNKAWRPLPSDRLTISQAEKLLWGAVPVIGLITLCTGGFPQYVLLTALNFWYNDGGGAHNPIFRNLINACGFVLYASAAIDIVATAPLSTYTLTIFQWLAVIGGVVLTTIQIQDLRDQAGDSLRGRPTLPISIGDGNARWTVIVPILFWSTFPPFFWRLDVGGYGLTVLTGAFTIGRLCFLRTSEGDRTTFKIWSLWLVSIYSLPLIKMYYTRREHL